MNTLPFLLQFDGASDPNPGLSGIGWVLYDSSRTIVQKGSKFIGFATNNQAEYNALIHGIRNAHELGIQHLQIQGDSLLIVNQIKGLWKIKDSKLAILHQEAKSILTKFSSFTIEHIPRHLNSEADLLSKEAIIKS